MLNKLSEAIRGNLTKIQRLKIVALVTIEVHARDIVEKMIKSGCSDITAFEWLSQLRVYWDKVMSCVSGHRKFVCVCTVCVCVCVCVCTVCVCTVCVCMSLYFGCIF